MWYDWFSRFYDDSLEGNYRPLRAAAVDALRLPAGGVALDLPRGTGQSLDLLAATVGPAGRVVKVDLSAGCSAGPGGGWDETAKGTSPSEGPRSPTSTATSWPPRPGGRAADGVLCALGLTAMPDWEAAFDRLFARVRRGGRFVLLDVYAAERTRHTRAVELVARADLSRRARGPLAGRCGDFTRELLPADPRRFGGEVYVAANTRG